MPGLTIIRSCHKCIAPEQGMILHMTSPVDPTHALGSLFAAVLGTPAAAAGAPTIPATIPGVLDFDRLGVTLLDYQREGVEYILANRSAYLGDEMGLGKTYQAIAAAALSGAAPMLVICPPSLTLNWRNEIRKLVP